MSFRHKNIRLRHEDYVGTRWFFITMCCANRRKLFVTGKFCNWFLRIVAQNAWTHAFDVHAYCLMPDHVHLLCEGLNATSDLLTFIKAVKLKSSTPFERRTGRPLWQKKFYDHVLRQNDSPDDVAWYIWMNPVRAGICSRPGEYPFLGSLAHPWTQTVKPFTEWVPSWKKNDSAAESPAPLHVPMRRSCTK